MAWSQLVPLPRGVLGRQSTLCLSQQHSDTWTSPPSSPQRCALTVAVGVGVVPSAALLTPWPGKLRPAETPPGGVAASRQRPDSAAAAHCKRENVCSALGVQDKARGKMGLFMRLSNGHVGAALSVQTVDLCKFLHIPQNAHDTTSGIPSNSTRRLTLL